MSVVLVKIEVVSNGMKLKQAPRRNNREWRYKLVLVAFFEKCESVEKMFFCGVMLFFVDDTHTHTVFSARELL